MTGPVVDVTVVALPPPGVLSPGGRSAVTRDLLRRLVADRLSVAVARVGVTARCARCGGPHGRPVPTVDGRPTALHASVSRAGSLAAVVLAEVPVGVDVEEEARTEFAGFDGVALTGRERVAGGLSPADRAGLWAAKEALLKVSGAGLSVPPETVQLGRSWPGRVVDDPARPGRTVGLTELPVGAGYRGAVAADGGAAPVLRRVADPALRAAAGGTASR